CELALLGPEEVSVQRVVDVDTDAAVQVLSGVDDALAPLGRPELRNRQLVRRGQTLGQAPYRLPRRQTHAFGVDIGIGSPLRHSLEGGQWPLELLTRGRVFGRHLERLLADPEL